MTETAEFTMTNTGVCAFRLPPLILHPFCSTEDQGSLLESSRASLVLQGFMPQGQASIEDLDRQLLRGRYAELRMLYYIGKDLNRWIEQCAETASEFRGFAGRRVRPESFAVLLVQYIPNHVKTKLEGWGVLDFCSLFRRAFGLHAVLGELPPRDMFSTEFLRRYHRYLDQWYEQWLRNFPFDRLLPEEVEYELYASGEYSKKLAESWAADMPN
jgi:hypothetical protein